MAHAKLNGNENQRSQSSPNLMMKDDATKERFIYENRLKNPECLIQQINQQTNHNKLNRILNWSAVKPEFTINTNKTNNFQDTKMNTNQNFINEISSHNINIIYKNNNNNYNKNKSNDNDNENNNRSYISDKNESHEMDNSGDSLEGMAIESTVSLSHSNYIDGKLRVDHHQMNEGQNDCQMFKQDNDFLESSIYSEFLSQNDNAEMDANVNINYVHKTNNDNYNDNDDDKCDVVVDTDIDIDDDNALTTLHNLSNASSENSDHNMKRPKQHQKHRSKSKCSASVAALIRVQKNSLGYHLLPPPHYTAIYVDRNYNHCDTALRQFVNTSVTNSSIFYTSNQPVAGHTVATSMASIPNITITTSGSVVNYLHRPIMATAATSITTTTATATTTAARVALTTTSTTSFRTRYHDQRQRNLLSYPVNFHRNRHTPEISSINWVLRKWCTQPSLPFIIGVLALSGVACTLVGIVLGSTGLIGHSTQYLSAALLLIGIGVSLLVISGAIWRLSLPDLNECRCYQRMEVCRTCSSPFCENRIFNGGYIYPEFQHRAPPPSYMTSLYGCNTSGLNFIVQSAGVGINTPPPVYQSTNSLRTLHSENPDNNLSNNEFTTNTNNMVNNQTVKTEKVTSIL